MTPGIVVKNLSFRFGTDLIFENLNLTIPGGAFVALLGPSGVGKTSLLKILAGLETPTTGEVAGGDGKPLAGRVAYMAQQDLLLPWLGAIDNVMLGARLRGVAPERARAEEMLRRVGLAGRANAPPAELSGGMRSRVALARTLYEQRPVVLLDEPFSALDALTRLNMQDLAAELLAGCTVLFITHDPLEACRLGHQLLVLDGAPARLAAPVVLPGTPPRAADDAAVLQAQATLLRRLRAA